MEIIKYGDKMNNDQLLTELLQCADEIDASSGLKLAGEANVLTRIAMKVAQMSDWNPTEDFGDASRAGFYDNGEEAFEREQAAQDEMDQRSELDKARETVQFLMPHYNQLSSDQHLELAHAKSIIDSATPSRRLEETDFARKLLDGGAELS